MLFEIAKLRAAKEAGKVLILILMEYALWGFRISPTKWDLMNVLILILMEYALWVRAKPFVS